MNRAISKILPSDDLLFKLLSEDDVYNKVLSSEKLTAKLFENPRLLQRIQKDENLISKLAKSREIQTTVVFEEIWQALRDHINCNRPDFDKKINLARASIGKHSNIRDAILNLICEGDEILLANGRMRFPDRHSLWIVCQEILINEEYYFESDTESPRILDCGTHFGMAIYYFKNLYPKAKITGFEPVPALQKLACENVKTNGYSNVNILPYALSDKQGPASFIISNQDSMAGSLTERRVIRGDDVTEITVKRRRLSTYLKEPVHFLKLDIEGIEDKVLKEASPFLGNVQSLCCEYHQGNGLASGRFSQILTILHEAGFETAVSKSLRESQIIRKRQMKNVLEPYSLVIWARNTNMKK